MGGSLVKNTTIYALGDIAPKVLSFIIFPILTTYLSPAEYGIVNYINSIITFLMAFGVLGLNTYYLVHYYKLEDEREKKKLLGNLSIFIFLFNTLLSILIFIVGPYFFKYFETNIPFYPYMVIGLVTNIFNIIPVLPSALYRLQERPLPLTLLNILKGFVSFGFTLWLVVAWGFKAEGLLIAQMLIGIIFGIIFGWITIKNMIWNINFQQLKKALAFSLPLVPGTICYLLLSTSDRILIDKYVGLSQLGIYSTAATLAGLLSIISLGAYKAFEPYIFKKFGSEEFIANFKKLRDGFYLVILCGAFGLALFSNDFLIFFASPKYYSSSFYIPILLIGIVASSLTRLYSTVITARGKTKINSAIIIFDGLFSVTLNIIFLRFMGILAACITSSLTLSLTLLISIYFSKIKISNKRIYFSSLLIAGIVFLFGYCISIENVVLSICVKFMVYVGVCIMACYILGYNLSSVLSFSIINRNSKKQAKI